MDSPRFHFSAALFLLTVLALHSCSPSEGSPFGALGRHELSLLLPQAPPAWAALPELRMSVTWTEPGAGRAAALADPGSVLRIAVERGRPQAILARPSSRGRELLPAGALYPEGLVHSSAGSEDELELDWKGGYAASVAEALLGAGQDPWAYDLSRLAEEAEARCGDPWLLPALETARRLSSSEFRIDGFTQPERMAVSLPGSLWAPESPFAVPPLPTTEGGTAFSLAFLPEGLWRFVGGQGELLVSVDSQGGSTLFLSP